MPERVELTDVPFFQLSDAQGGPSALAALLNYHGVISSPGLVDERMQQLGKGQSPQAGLEAVARSYELVVYPLPGNLDALMQQISAGHPVLVLQDRLFGGPGSQFAVLVGYDAARAGRWCCVRAMTDAGTAALPASTTLGGRQDAGQY